MTAKIRVLIAEDSTTTRELLIALLVADPGFEIAGEATNGADAIGLAKKLRPNVIVMDVQMPQLDGFEATRRIMIEAPTPIVIVSASVDVNDVAVAMHALRVGALAAIAKPGGPSTPTFSDDAGRFVETVRAMAQVKVVRRWADRQPTTSPPPLIAPSPVRPRIVAIAASTGGPAALQRVVASLPADFPLPILAVQHIARGFVTGFASWLNTAGSLRVKLADDGEPLAPHTVYVAPDDRHLGMTPGFQVALSDAPPIAGFRPSATHTFASIANHAGPSSVGVILTGMGEDGVAGLRDVRAAGGRVIAQDDDTSVVFGMPGAAVAAGLADWTLPIGAVAPTLLALLTKGESS